MTDDPSPRSRRYRGQNASERQADRRVRLLAAGLELFGTAGYAAVSVKQVCVQAGLTERYFYESFTDREDLLTAVYDEQINLVRHATLTALTTSEPTVRALATAGVGTFVRTVADDPRRARVIFIEVVGVSPALELRRRGVMREFAQVIVGIAGGQLGTQPGERLSLAAMIFAGGLTEVLVDWALGDQAVAIEQITAVAVTLLDRTFEVFRDELDGSEA
ncbi:TetR/AcrR family transcriptional regulator [Amycolatopsis nigrescens]|uniref:TetR/AcrR family transcriptional regulator n=1 Tax=Amycolatopsis nigrescens TaxID=381445 RepID=UPI00036670EB|nr:TetR/AcrR family transcriptional regulator [Amycolatopsis nigrescens]